MERQTCNRLYISLLAAALFFGAGEARAEKTFAFVGDHDPGKVIYALKYGADVVRAKGQFRLFLGGGRSVLMFVPVYKKAALVHKAYREIHAKAPGVKVIACKEVVDKVKKAVKASRIPFLPGVRVRPCKDKKKEMLSDGWRPALGM